MKENNLERWMYNKESDSILYSLTAFKPHLLSFPCGQHMGKIDKMAHLVIAEGSNHTSPSPLDRTFTLVLPVNHHKSPKTVSFLYSLRLYLYQPRSLPTSPQKASICE